MVVCRVMAFLVSRRSRWRPKDSRPCVRPSVRPYVRTYVTLLLENRSLLFSETLQLVRACKCEKNVPSAFLKKNPVLPILAKNWPKLAILAQNAQKWRFYAFFRNPFIIICSFFVLNIVFGVGKKDVFVFFGKIQKWPFLAKFRSFFSQVSYILLVVFN